MPNNLPLTPTAALGDTAGGDYHPPQPDPHRLMRSDLFVNHHYLLRATTVRCLKCTSVSLNQECFLVKVHPAGIAGQMLLPVEQTLCDLPIQVVTPKPRRIPFCLKCASLDVKDEEAWSKDMQTDAKERASSAASARWEAARQRQSELEKTAIKQGVKPPQHTVSRKEPPVDIDKLPI